MKVRRRTIQRRARGGAGGAPSIAALVRAASTANVNTTTGGLLTIDGIPLVADDEVLLRVQSTAADRGVWTVKAGAWVQGVQSGMLYGKGIFLLTATNTYSLAGASPI